MNAAAWSITEDIMPLLGFTAALITVLMIPIKEGGLFNRAAKWFFVASIMCYFISSGASILGHFPDFLGVFHAPFDAFNSVMPLVELLWVPFMLFGVYALYSNQQLHDSIAARHEVVQAGQMLESVMDTTPAGVVVIDSAGAITFANPEARRLLDMDDRSASDGAKWSVFVGDAADFEASNDRRGDFQGLLGAEPLQNASVTVSWPNGWRRNLQVNTTPLRDGESADSGAVVAFVEREPWTPTVRAVGPHGLR
jgi:PAS domain-containing protein